jgi:diguanylate cyclase (GGDEF)-like protein
LERAKPRMASDDAPFDSYVQLAKSLIGELSAVCLVDGRRRIRGLCGDTRAPQIQKVIEDLRWNGPQARLASLICTSPGQWLTAIPLEQTDSTLLGVLCVQQALPHGPAQLNQHAAEISRRLKPLLDCIYRDLVAALPSRERVQTLTERTAQLEWLLRLAGDVRAAPSEQAPIEQLLAAAAQRLDCAMGILEIPDKRLRIEYLAESTPDGGWSQGETLRGVWQQTRRNLLNWAQLRHRPLVVGSVGRTGDRVPRCKILSVPAVHACGRVIGFLAFYNPPSAPDFSNGDIYLAQHVGRQAATLVDSQFDLMTGLYTSEGLSQSHRNSHAQTALSGSLLYFDIDQMQPLNELHGFEFGNELIVRIADLLTPPMVPDNALSARMSGDRFVVLLPETDAASGRKVAEQLQAAARNLRIGPLEAHIEVSISCGVANLVAMPEGLDRAIAAAEIACKSAKILGRDRLVVYASDDGSMMQRYDAAIAVGRLRAALKSDRLSLYADRVEQLRHAAHAGAYQLVMRIREEDGTVGLLGPLLATAERYQLWPSLDRWAVKSAFQTLAPHRSTLQQARLSIALKLADQSIADSAFGEYLLAELKSAQLPAGCITLVLGASALPKNFAQVSALIRRLQAQGCQFELDGFGEGARSLDCIKILGIRRVQIGDDLVRGAVTSGKAMAAVRAMVELACAESMSTVACGADNDEQLQLLRELRVDFARGSAVGAPQPLEELLQKLDTAEAQRMSRLHLEM